MHSSCKGLSLLKTTESGRVIASEGWYTDAYFYHIMERRWAKQYDELLGVFLTYRLDVHTHIVQPALTSF